MNDPAGWSAPDRRQIILEQWVKTGIAPESMIATKSVHDFNPAQGVEMTRPRRPYPQVARYKRTEDTNGAANFVCSSNW